MAADERQDTTPEHDAEQVEELEDLEAEETEAANVKGGGPKSESSQTGPGPENLR